MLSKTARAADGSRPAAHWMLLSGGSLIRRVKRALFERGSRRTLKRFRQYCAALPTLVSEPVFVKVGANDGVTKDPCSDLLLANDRWRGLLIEPVPFCFERLQANFRDHSRFAFERIAVGATAGKATFYYVDEAAARAIPDLPPWFDQLGSFDRNHIAKHLSGRLVPFIVECDIDVAPLSSVLSRNGIRDIHLLHIDTEGYDYEVLKTLDLSRYLPVAIFIEHKHLPPTQRTEMLELLRGHGYLVHDAGGDYFALHLEADERLRRTARARAAAR